MGQSSYSRTPKPSIGMRYFPRCMETKVPCHVVPLDTIPSGVNSVHTRTPHPFRIRANTTDFYACLFVGVLSGVFLPAFFLYFCTHKSSLTYSRVKYFADLITPIIFGDFCHRPLPTCVFCSDAFFTLLFHMSVSGH
jgi:hypothetical protein